MSAAATRSGSSSVAPPGVVDAGGADGPRRKPGRPRDARADAAIMEAVIELLVEEGFGGLTVDAVAHRAGVGKATIYRRWPGKEQLVLDALAATKDDVATPDSGSTRDDLFALYAPMVDPANQQAVVRLLPALAAEAAVNPELADQLHAFIAGRRGPAVEVLERARRRGEVAADADVDHLIDLIAGPFLYRLFFTGAPVSTGLLTATIDLVLRASAP